MAETDSEVKYRRMIDVLSKADYFVISSNRFYDAQPRVLRRFSMSSEYFNRLFGGKLELHAAANLPARLGFPRHRVPARSAAHR